MDVSNASVGIHKLNEMLASRLLEVTVSSQLVFVDIAPGRDIDVFCWLGKSFPEPL